MSTAYRLGQAGTLFGGALGDLEIYSRFKG